MTSPTSGSETSASFDRLHPSVQRWVYEQGWTSLHDAQETAIGPILEGVKDVIISAATAAGKTEAAFLPALSAVASARDANVAMRPGTDPWAGHDPWAEPPPPFPGGIEILYVAPLKALINDQFGRLELMGAMTGIEVNRWHGDVAASAKANVRKSPKGVLLITPESIEALLVNRGTEIPPMFAGLRYVIVDELHSFLATPRGAQLQSLLCRIELAIRHRPSRIGLSATLGDMSAATRFLRPSDPDSVVVIDSSSDHQDLKLQVRGYLHTRPAALATAPPDSGPDEDTGADVTSIAAHLFSTLRGTDNLVFANSRHDVEVFADRLGRLSEEARVPNEFWPHHGSLSRDAREILETQLKDSARRVTAVCTSTLEMGIDIGSVSAVGQIGTPPSVAAMRQRLGRSGRRGVPAVMRLYIRESELDARSHPHDELRCDLVQSIAMVELLLEKWLEGADDPGWNLSTLTQQIMSVIAQLGGARPVEIHRALCGPGPFELVEPALFARLLRCMARSDLIFQTDDGTLLHGQVGERFVNHYSFYAAFETPEEWRLFNNGRELGTLPITTPLEVGGRLIFGGRRWTILTVDEDRHVLDLAPSPGGVPPKFGGNGPSVGDRVRVEMVNVYRDSSVPPWLDSGATALLAEARRHWHRLDLDNRVIVPAGTGVVVFPWLGDRAIATATLMLGSAGLSATVEGPTIEVLETSSEELSAVAADLLAASVDPVDLARQLKNLRTAKWDWILDDDLAAESAAVSILDSDGARLVLERIVGKEASFGH